MSAVDRGKTREGLQTCCHKVSYLLWDVSIVRQRLPSFVGLFGSQNLKLLQCSCEYPLDVCIIRGVLLFCNYLLRTPNLNDSNHTGRRGFTVVFKGHAIMSFNYSFILYSLKISFNPAVTNEKAGFMCCRRRDHDSTFQLGLEPE